jgi:ABC-type dipeptide/oligopeptide/nickel transport system permease subunit
MKTTKATTAMATASRVSLAQMVGVGGLVVFALVGLFGPLCVEPPAVQLAFDLAAPTRDVPLGWGELGVPVHTALVWGARGALVVGVAVTAVSTCLSVGLAWVCALGPRPLRRLILRIADMLLAFPSLLLALSLAALLPPSVISVVVALSISAWASPLQVLVLLADRLVRSDAVTAATVLGASRFRLAVVHLWPLLVPTIVVQASQQLGAAVVGEATLAFLGLASPPLSPPFFVSWGALLDDGLALSMAAPHLWWPPAACVCAVAVCAQLAVVSGRDQRGL